MSRIKTLAEQLPQFDWKYCVERGLYVVLMDVYGGRIRYYPYTSVTPREVREDIEGLLRRNATPETYGLPLRLYGGRLGTHFAEAKSH